MSAWWNAQTAGWIGAIAGTANGVLGGLLGTVAGLSVPRGRRKGWVYAIASFMLGIGLGALLCGLTAAIMHQPYVVWYPLVLLGGIDTLVVAITWPVIIRGYRQADARRLAAQELRRS